MKISNLVFMTWFWDNLHQLRSKPKIYLKAKLFKSLGARKPKDSQNRLQASTHVCLREKYLSFNNN